MEKFLCDHFLRVRWLMRSSWKQKETFVLLSSVAKYTDFLIHFTERRYWWHQERSDSGFLHTVKKVVFGLAPSWNLFLFPCLYQTSGSFSDLHKTDWAEENWLCCSHPVENQSFSFAVQQKKPQTNKQPKLHLMPYLKFDRLCPSGQPYGRICKDQFWKRPK